MPGTEPAGAGAEDAFLADLVGLAALKAALESGLADRLAPGHMDVAAVAREAKLPREGLERLLSLLERAGIVDRSGERAGLTDQFAAVLRHRRTILEAKLWFLRQVVPDVQEGLAPMILDPLTFQARSRTFELFRYDQALDITPEAIAATRPWVRYVTALTEAEAPALAPRIDLSGARRMIEVGGNSGAFAEALMERNPELSAVIIDLPAVCAIGEARTGARDGRLKFLPGDARAIDWPGPADAVLFKSVLHDWPDAEVRRFLGKARDALRPGGKIVICERGPFELPPGPVPLFQAANLVFATFYREPDYYVRTLAEMGLRCAPIRTVSLDLPFHIVEAIAGLEA